MSADDESGGRPFRRPPPVRAYQALTPEQYYHFVAGKIVSAGFLVFGSLCFLGAGAQLVLPDGDRTVPAAAWVGFALLSLAGAVGGGAAYQGNRTWARLGFLFILVFGCALPIGTLLSLLWVFGLSRYLAACDRLKTARLYAAAPERAPDARPRRPPAADPADEPPAAVSEPPRSDDPFDFGPPAPVTAAARRPANPYPFPVGAGLAGWLWVLVGLAAAALAVVAFFVETEGRAAERAKANRPPVYDPKSGAVLARTAPPEERPYAAAGWAVAGLLGVGFVVGGFRVAFGLAAGTLPVSAVSAVAGGTLLVSGVVMMLTTDRLGTAIAAVVYLAGGCGLLLPAGLGFAARGRYRAWREGEQR